MEYHCPEYENLTIEEKLLVDAEMREWFAEKDLGSPYIPSFIFKEAEKRIITIIKEENDKRNREQSVGGADNKQSDTGNSI